jgi:hypothetical protein
VEPGIRRRRLEGKIDSKETNMSTSTRRKRPPSLRFKLAVVSFLSFLVTTACSWMRLRATPTPEVLCYVVVAPTDTPTPVVMCYEMVVPTETPDTFTSPLPTPTTTPEARRMLQNKLLADNRFPSAVARRLES